MHTQPTETASITVIGLSPVCLPHDPQSGAIGFLILAISGTRVRPAATHQNTSNGLL